MIDNRLPAAISKSVKATTSAARAALETLAEGHWDNDGDAVKVLKYDKLARSLPLIAGSPALLGDTDVVPIYLSTGERVASVAAVIHPGLYAGIAMPTPSVLQISLDETPDFAPTNSLIVHALTEGIILGASEYASSAETVDKLTHYGVDPYGLVTIAPPYFGVYAESLYSLSCKSKERRIILQRDAGTFLLPIRQPER